MGQVQWHVPCWLLDGRMGVRSAHDAGQHGGRLRGALVRVAHGGQPVH
jgi:MOSC domain-containing protein YiiM